MDFIVAVDGSPESRSALEYATELAAAVDGHLTAVHVVDPRVFDAGGDETTGSFSEVDRRLIAESVSDAEDRGLALLEEVAAASRDLGHEVDTKLLYGDPVVELTDHADAAGVDGIFVGHRGLSERTEAMVGSVAKAVVERATVPVTVVR